VPDLPATTRSALTTPSAVRRSVSGIDPELPDGSSRSPLAGALDGRRTSVTTELQSK
jgi:hypothetical protein